MNRTRLFTTIFPAILLFFLWVVSLEKYAFAINLQQPDKHKASDPQAYFEPDAYQIYAALLLSDKQDTQVTYVIQSEIHAYPNLTARNLGINGGRDFMRVWGAVMEDYAKQNRTDKVLSRRIPTNIPYELLAERDILASKAEQSFWDDFYQRHPASGGYHWFSAVGFNPRHTRAIVNVNHSCGMLCGGGGPRFFEKKGTKWAEVRPSATVLVWAS